MAFWFSFHENISQSSGIPQTPYLQIACPNSTLKIRPRWKDTTQQLCADLPPNIVPVVMLLAKWFKRLPMLPIASMLDQFLEGGLVATPAFPEI